MYVGVPNMIVGVTKKPAKIMRVVREEPVTNDQGNAREIYYAIMLSL